MKKKETIKGYKGFGPDLRCRGFQYKVGEEYDTDKAASCETGFHFCENPFDVFNYYSPSDENGMNRFCEVEGSGEFDKSKNEKVACTHIKINSEIGLDGLIKAGIKFILDKVNWINSKEYNKDDYSTATSKGDRSAATNTGDYSVATNTGSCSAVTNTGNRSVATGMGDLSAATNTGNKSVATNTGNCSSATNTGNGSAATNTGYRSAATNTGYRSATTNTGECSAATNTGNCSAAINTGERSVATNTGDRSVATNTGNWSVATNTGDLSEASVEGKESIAIATGVESKAKGALGCWIVLTERIDLDREFFSIKEVKAFKVDGTTIKENTYYKLMDGEPVETN